jgi:hypothetical protein
MVWITSRIDGWWYCYEHVRLSAGQVTQAFGPFGSEELAWSDAQGRIDGRDRGGFRDAERSYTL